MGFSLGRVVAVLERTPSVLRSMLSGHGGEQVTGGYGPGTWSAYEVVGHLIVGEREDWLPRVRIILEHGAGRAFAPFPHDAAIGPGSGRTMDDLLGAFERLRAGNLEALRGLGITDAQLSLRGRHPALGEVTLSQLLAAWAAHDLHHVRQAARAMAWQWREHVGPWRAYLNTLDP